MMLFRAVLLILLLANSIAFAADTATFRAKVIGVLDGDTIEVLKDKAPVRVRLYGIDCPEHDQDFGTRAKQFTSDQVFGKTVEVIPIEKDKYERLVAKIYIDGKYLNQMIVSEGFAWWYKLYAPKDEDLKKAENEARTAKKGLWSHPDPVPPWEFRRKGASSHRKTEPKPESKALFHGNVKSKVFHKTDCRDFNCVNCTANFNSPEEASKNGYRPCKLCSP